MFPFHALVLLSVLQSGNCFVVFDCAVDEFCQYNESVQYQCTANDSNVLRWRIRNENMTSLDTDTESYSNGDDPDGSFAPINDVPHFTTALLSTSPLISNISFTVQSSINGYNINCEDGDGLVKNCPIIIYDSNPPPPINVTIYTDENELEAWWTPPNITSQCVTVSSYSITSNATNSIITTTDTSVDIPLAGLSPGVYCVSVATVDTASRTGEYSDEECLELTIPAKPYIEYHIIHDEDFAYFNVSWIFNRTVPPLLTSVYLIHNISGHDTAMWLSPDDNYFVIINSISSGIYYVVMFGENIIGNGTNTTIQITVVVQQVITSTLLHTTGLYNLIPTVQGGLGSTTGNAVHCHTSCPVTSTTPMATTSNQYYTGTPTIVESSANTVCWDTLYIAITVLVTFLLTLTMTAIITAVITLLITKKCCNVTPQQAATTPMVVSCNNLNTEELCQSDRVYEDLAITDFRMASNQAYGKARGAPH